MTYAEINTMVESIGLPYAYYDFEEEQNAPFVIFYYPDSNDVYADGVNYQPITTLIIELYTNYRDFDKEQTIETILRNNNLTFVKHEERQANQKAYGIQYQMEVLVNG